jgi:1-acyl-sn-glycerol-3-phosphate acyltransferase
MGWISRIILRLWGWKAEGYEKLHHLPKYVLAIGPHTSNWDFPLGVLVRSAYGLHKVRFLGKESLFRFPYGWIFRALGGYPVVRGKHVRQVDSYVEAFQSHDEFAIVIAPEGTRKKVARLKTGYYFIAKKAGVPIVPSIMNYERKVVEFYDPVYPTDDEQADLDRFEAFFRDRPGKYRELCF